MGTATDSTSLAEVRNQRADLHAALIELEQAIANPLGARDWTEGVHEALVELAATFERHIAVTEGRDGLFDDVVRVSPRMANAVERLREEHGSIRRAVADALAEVRALSRAEDGGAGQLRETVLRVFSELARHRQQGADLVYETYTVDIGGSE